MAAGQVTGGDRIVEALRAEGVRHVFGIPGVHNLAIYDALLRQSEITHVLARHEAGAAFMADGYARASGAPGVVVVTTGPGATNALTPRTVWREYEFKGKPGDASRPPPQIAPYHLRLDWLMWFAAMSAPSQHPWFSALLAKLLEGDPATLGLLKTNPFAERPPRYIRAVYYTYRFTTPEERRQTARWWNRERLGLYVAPVSLTSPGKER